jgi:hypothetical protein
MYIYKFIHILFLGMERIVYKQSGWTEDWATDFFQFSSQWIMNAPLTGIKVPSYLLPRLRMSIALPILPQYVFMT